MFQWRKNRSVDLEMIATFLSLEISAMFLTGEEVSALASLASFISLAFVSLFFCHYYYFFHVLCAFLLISGWHQAGITYWLSFQMPVFSLCLLFYVWLLASVKQYYVLLCSFHLSVKTVHIMQRIVRYFFKHLWHRLRSIK